ncbi:phage regulatory CII family protein [Aquabacterium commune]|uniref:phage regulatory CII family protein n=1 Tax=Aquabacterium commune TaxID=70586 RepID=UPI003BB1027B
MLNKSAKVIAADMDMSPSTLSRKLNPSDGDTQRFNLDDMEAFLESTGDAPAVIEYLAAKYMDSPEARKARALTKVERLAEEMASAMAALRAAA